MPVKEGPGPRTDRSHSTRHKARKRAVDILFEADLRDADPLVTLADRTGDDTPPVRAFTAELVRGVAAAQDSVDGRIAETLTGGWTLERLPRVDRVVLRLALHELDRGETPADVVISEAVNLVGELSTDESPGFVNGVLARLAGTPEGGS